MKFCWMGSMYQLLSVWNVLCQYIINDSDWKTEGGRGQPIYQPARCLQSCFFFLAVVTPPPPPPPFVSTHSKSSCAMAAQVPLLSAYQLSISCRWWNRGVSRTSTLTSPEASCDWPMSVGKSAWWCFKWETPGEQTHFAAVVAQYVSQTRGSVNGWKVSKLCRITPNPNEPRYSDLIHNRVSQNENGNKRPFHWWKETNHVVLTRGDTLKLIIGPWCNRNKHIKTTINNIYHIIELIKIWNQHFRTEHQLIGRSATSWQQLKAKMRRGARCISKE